MPAVHAPAEPTHDPGDTRFTSLVTPTTGATDSAVWRVELAPGTPATPHSLTREEVSVGCPGSPPRESANAHATAQAGDAIVVPAGQWFELSNGADEPLQMICCMPVRGRPPWLTGRS